MKYTNASQVLPKELLEQIQEYIQGEYLYIPIKEKKEAAGRDLQFVRIQHPTDYH